MSEQQKFHAAPAGSASGGAPAEDQDELDVRIEEELTDPTPPVQPVQGDADKGDSAHADGIERESTKTRRARSKKMSLRIPDDEVVRPSQRAPAAEPAEEPIPLSTPRPAIAPSRIIAINPPSNREPPGDSPDDAAAAAADDAFHDAPTRHDVSDLDVPDGPESLDRITPDPVTRPSPKVEEPTQADLHSDHSSPAAVDEAAALADGDRSSIPVTMDESEPDPDRTVELPKLDAKSALADEGVDVEVETEEPQPASDEPEIGADDLVSIESVPVPVKKKSVPPAAPPMPLAYQSGDFPAQPSAPNVQVVPPIVVVPPAAPATSASASASPSPSASPSASASPPSASASASTSQPAATATSTAAASAAAAAADAKKRVRPWWEDLFNDDFVRTMAKISDKQIAKEASFIEESLGVESGSALLDLGCGTGLHAIELTKRGYNVVGFDLSLAMLAKAADEAQDRKQKLNFVQGDMREMAFDELFDGVYSWNTSFGFFDEEKNGQVVTRVHRALKKGGQFLLDVINRDYIIRQSPSLAWFEGDGCICMDEMQVDFITSRMRVKRTMMMDDGRSREIEYSMRVYSLHELGKMLHEHGFRVAEVSGRLATPGVFFGNESPRILVLAEKR